MNLFYNENYTLSAAKILFKTVKEEIGVANRAIDAYNAAQDPVEPWTNFQREFAELKKYHSKLPTTSENLLADMKIASLFGMDLYYRSVQNVYEWGGLMESLLNKYKFSSLFKHGDTSNPEILKKTLVYELEKGFDIMKQAIVDFDKSSEKINIISGKLGSLNAILRDGSDLKNDVYRQKVQNLFEQADKVKSVLRDELRIVSDLKVKTEETKAYLTLGSDFVGFAYDLANELIEGCQKFHARHSA